MVFGKRIADTRNYLTHRDDESRGAVLAATELSRGFEKFRYFLLVLMMRDLGIPPAETVAAIQSNDRRASILQWDGL